MGYWVREEQRAENNGMGILRARALTGGEKKNQNITSLALKIRVLSATLLWRI